ncbi:ATP-binding protein [Bacillus cereus]|uniref:sensor histidine kinase n=1 Tax=Bacillus cereus TaxID=1396 RepID=UPI003D0491EA
MYSDKITFLNILQLICIIALFLADLNNQLLGINKLALYAVLFFFTTSLLFTRIRFVNRLKIMIEELERVIKGNLTTRLIVNEDDVFNKMIFSVNELIEQLEKVQIETIKSQNARKRLLSSISHDIRTPLTSIIGYIDALKDDIAVSGEEKKEYLEIISRKSSNLKQLINEIFNMAKLDADEVVIYPELLELTEITREALIEHLPEIKKNNLELKLNLPKTKCFIMADYLSIIRIIDNLIKNAIIYGKEGKVLGIELIESHKEFQLLIWDKGQGIAKHELDNVFERMYRSDQSRNSINGGSGLGLSIAKSLVEKNQGKIWVESSPWNKTVFGIYFPKTEKF